MSSHKENLTQFVEGLINKEDVQKLYQTYEADIQVITPMEVFEMMSARMRAGETPQALLPFVDKLINVFYMPLKGFQWQRPAPDTFLNYLMLENDALIGILEAFKNVIKSSHLIDEKPAIAKLLKQCFAYESHLQKLENILFPYLEKRNNHFEGLKIMWTLHDETRRIMKTMDANVSRLDTNEALLKVQLGQLYFKLYGLVQKQDLLLFPAATSCLSDADFLAMHMQSFDYVFPYISRPEKPDIALETLLYEHGGVAYEYQEMLGDEKLIQTETGIMTITQMIQMLNHLPVDITFVDAEDKVAFFTKPKKRIFPRSPAVIGRDVRNCHPAESVHVVERILEDFRNGVRDQETFWIQMKEMFILIQYFAVRDESGQYMGTLEVSQEIGEIRRLTGEKRLLSS
ncbi:DUF438 domain-containing protein [Fusibacter paucivorans]|uniref:DUF438 domain-containing protein n=1 Tax=Fusibacter paucivorans TaxID=76009 RepID=A0ABS5PM14_9FIRM|nr:PAS domain-containing protein [Fusibacter paucivorans]MBS7526210.1 DUF438 domain-containing protein [Fusibacter paucivorans]